LSPARARTPRGSAVHQGLVGARKLVGTPYLAKPALRDEYARDIAPRTEAALARILAEVYGPQVPAGELIGSPSVEAIPSPRAAPPARAIDLGAGTGAVGRTLRARFGENLPVVAVDILPGPGVQQTDLAYDLPSIQGKFDLVVAAHILNELFVDRLPAERVELRAGRVLAWSKSLLAAGGMLVLLEPALRHTSRELLGVRDLLVTAGLEIVAPCFWTGPCPALARERDWCHDAAPIANGARVDYSYLVLRSPVDRAAPGSGIDGSAVKLRTTLSTPTRPTPIPTPDTSTPMPSTSVPTLDASLFRIVSDPMVEKGRLRFFGCGPAGRHPLVRLDRHLSPKNAPFDTLHRGSVTRIAPTQSLGDGLRLSPDTAVVSLDPPERA